MPANSIPRRVLKRILYPVLNGKGYQTVQSLAKAWDIFIGSGAEPEQQLIPFAVRAGDTALDIGANYGFYAYPLSRAVGPRGKVVAFEPVPFVCGAFRQVGKILRFRNVELIPKGCSDRTGPVAFTLPIQGSGAPSAGLTHMGLRNNERGGKDLHFPYPKTEVIWCEVVRLDDFLPELSDLSFVKCDIEGAELFAFRGAEKMIARHCPTVLCEINPWFLEGFGIELPGLVGFFLDRGYRLYRYMEREGRHRLIPVGLSEIEEDNYLFIHPRYRDRFLPVMEEG